MSTTPLHSSASNGAAERAIRSVDDEARTLRYDVEDRYGIKLTPDSVLWPWVVRHAAFLTARFAKRGSGTTSYQGAYGHSYTGELCPFGETVLFRIPKQSKRTHKADSAWRHGIWVGKAEESDEHLLATPDGIQRARTVRRLEPQGRADKAMFEQAVDRKSTRLNSSHSQQSRMPSSA